MLLAAMKPPYRLILIFAGFGLVCPLARGQANQPILDKTTFGHSQNDGRDLQNSLIVPNRVHIKGEKTEQVDPQKLSSRSTKDAKFQGSLLDMGLGSANDPDSHLEKARSATDQDSNALKPANASSEKDSKVSKQADSAGDKNSKASKPTQTGESQNKDQKATSAASDEKSSKKEKTSASKTDGDH
jgi:hypothetical protein